VWSSCNEGGLLELTPAFSGYPAIRQPSSVCHSAIAVLSLQLTTDLQTLFFMISFFLN
jgi:hypothetical protein